MHPTKRRRDADDVGDDAFAFAPPRHAHGAWFARDELQANRSVRGPALAPTTRGSTVWGTYTRADDRFHAAEPHGRRSPRSTPSPQLPGLTQMLGTTRRAPSCMRTSRRGDNDSHHDVVSVEQDEDEDSTWSRQNYTRPFRQSTFPSHAHRARLDDTSPPPFPRRNASSDTVSSAGFTPLSDSPSFRDSTSALRSPMDALPVHVHSRRPQHPSSSAAPALVRGDSTSSVEAATPPPGAKTLPSYPCVARTLTKSSRYLREIDRRNILQRIENGEKQAALAKEYQVSRAAICNLNKHRDAVLSRKDENPLAKHPKRPRPKGVPTKIKITSKPNELATSAAFVCELKSRATALLLTLLRSPETNATDFRRYADRILRLILEEALALVPVKNVHVAVNESVQIEGVRAELRTCAVALEVTGGAHFLRVFQQLEPHQSAGSIRIRGAQVDAHVPPDLTDHNVFLFDLFTYSGDIVCTALAMLLSRGAKENCVWLVSLCVAYEVAELVHARFPQVKIITAQVDRSNMPVLSDNNASATAEGAAAVVPVVTKPDIPTKVLVKRFLQAYEPRREPRATAEGAPNSETQQQQLI